MNTTETITLLGWLCYAAGAAAMGVYAIHFAGRQGWKRPWNAAGLFFTAIALSQLPSLFRNADETGQMLAAVVVALCLIAATVVQSMTALRQRKRADEQVLTEATAQ